MLLTSDQLATSKQHVRTKSTTGVPRRNSRIPPPSRRQYSSSDARERDFRDQRSHADRPNYASSSTTPPLAMEQPFPLLSPQLAIIETRPSHLWMGTVSEISSLSNSDTIIKRVESPIIRVCNWKFQSNQEKKRMRGEFATRTRIQSDARSSCSLNLRGRLFKFETSR